MPCPTISGQVPSRIAELTVLLQALIPLTFAYSVSRYRMMDFEVLLKKAATLVFSYFVLACLYIVLSSRTQMSSENKLNVLILGILAMVLGATLFYAAQEAHRFRSSTGCFTGASYHYRKTLLIHQQGAQPGKEPAEAAPSPSWTSSPTPSPWRTWPFSCRRRDESRTFSVACSQGGASPRCRAPHSRSGFSRLLNENEYIAVDCRPRDGSAARAAEVLAVLGIVHFLPLQRREKPHRLPGHGQEDSTTRSSTARTGTF